MDENNVVPQENLTPEEEAARKAAEGQAPEATEEAPAEEAPQA